ncbi:MAG: DUF2703 domain-containing protein [Candidatus Aenigmatarchaeota archaeon]
MLKIEFLYYDKTTCKRCASTNESVTSTLKELKKAIKNIKVNFKEKKLPESMTSLSPSIRINGKDIEKIVNKDSRLKSNVCSDCCRMAKHTVNCRTFNYKGKRYNHIPKGMIKEAINVAMKK